MIEVLRQLSEEDLRQIGRAIRSGRLSPPFTGVALRRYLAGEPGEALAVAMQRQCDEGLSPEHLALMLELLAEDRSRRAGVAEMIDLVSTGPEAPGIANRDTAVVVRELFSNARKFEGNSWDMRGTSPANTSTLNIPAPAIWAPGERLWTTS